MALFDTQKKGAPTDLVLQMRRDGLSNNQVIQNLQRQGFDSNQIFDAMSLADMKMQDVSQTKDFRMPQAAPQPQQAPSFPEMSSLVQESASQDQIEEIVEALIDEKWDVFEGSVKKLLAWKSDVDIAVGKLEQRMKGLEEQMKTMQEGIFGKIGEYDKHITHIGTELKAVDKVFQKVLPALAENVSELGAIAQKLKGK